MSTVSRYRKYVQHPPTVIEPRGFSLREFDISADTRAWLSIRKSSLAGQLREARDWTGDDLAHELLRKPWWSPACTLMAIHRPADRAVGTVTLEVKTSTRARIHWLMVHRDFQRRGIGRWLLHRCELKCHQNSILTLGLETLATWKTANACYEACGYELAED